MKRHTFTTILTGILMSSILTINLHAQGMQDAKTAVANMRVGWNMGNSLDSNSGATDNMWIEAYTSRTPTDYEKSWGQAPATRQLIHAFKEAGFNAVRIPVTWYPHYGTLNNTRLTWDKAKWTGYTVNAAWMKRVKQVVDYVIAEGMYCILNVHHDTGTATTAWITASTSSHAEYQERFTRLWTAIATEFKNYDDYLLFEGYNEMTDKHNSWCFASFAAPGSYNAADAKDAYDAVNAYAQDFVKAVRATGGKNAERNLIVNTYAACCGAGSWNTHLQDPLKQMALPEDDDKGHLIFQVHSYWNTNDWGSAQKSDIDKMLNNLDTYLVKKHDAPVIIGEWGSDASDFNYNDATQRSKLLSFATYFTSHAKAKGITCFYWMGLSDGADRTTGTWTQPELRDAIIKGYYGEEGYDNGIHAATHHLPTPLRPPHNLLGQSLPIHPLGIVIENGKKVVSK